MQEQLLYNEKELLVQIAGGDEQAFAKLFKTYYNHLGGFIVKLTESEPLTQEIVQDVFLKIWINRQSLKTVDCFRAYLFTVARNHAFNCLKQIAREKTRKREWVTTILSNAVSSEESLPETHQLIDSAIELLPPQQKKVYQLSRQEGIRNDEIAKRLNISLETVKKHMVLALRFLKQHLRAHTNFLLVLLAVLYRK